MTEVISNIYKDNYKLKDLKVYASTEWLADNKKKYRQVFERFNTSYIYAELSFVNRLFDVEDWEIELSLKCYAIKKGRRELCSLDLQRKVSKVDNIVYIREGWGNKSEGAFWKKGAYFWEAWIGGEKVATKYFYIEEPLLRDVILSDGNLYLEVTSLKLYEGPYDDIPEPSRQYLERFAYDETRYIYTEVAVRNLQISKSWHCELFIKFFNDSRELKGQVTRLQKIEKGQKQVKITAGWGSNVKGSWREDKYTAELIFMDKLLAIIPFEISSIACEGIPRSFLPYRKSRVALAADVDTGQSFEEVMAKLNNLIGLQDIKRKIAEHAQYLQFLSIRKEKGFEEKDEVNVHSVFIGNPGTGKTTVAKMMGLLYRKMGLLSSGHVYEVDRGDLVGEYIGQTAPKVKDAIEKARGGVLLIDEAYSLARSQEDSKDFGREVIEILVKEMSNDKGDLVVIAAGYPKEMKNFLNSNPGLKSRFKQIYTFDDYLPQELSQIAEFACKEKGVEFSLEAKAKIDEIIVEAYRNRDRTFGNARFVYDLIEKAKINLGLRIMSKPEPREVEKELLSWIEEEDIQKIHLKEVKESPYIPVDETALTDSMAELNKLIGMNRIKEQIKELVQLVRYYRSSGKNVLNNFYLHTVLVGNPGTGKTTVARILGRIYKALGILERGHIIETDRQGLVAGFVGQTAIKTTEKIEESMGGVLYIDEAYALANPSILTQADYGNEALQTILKQMEDSRGKFFVFVAGYPENMEQFLKANPGLNSRFDKVLRFDDYTPDELTSIAHLMLEEKGIEPTAEATERLSNYFEYLYERRDKYFGNARTVRAVISEAVKRQSLRLASLPEPERITKPAIFLTVEDIPTFIPENEGVNFNKKTIGFQRLAAGNR